MNDVILRLSRRTGGDRSTIGEERRSRDRETSPTARPAEPGRGTNADAASGPPSTRRRSFLGTAGLVLAGTAGCLGTSGESSEPTTRQYALTITRQEGALATTVEPAGDAPGVVTVSVGDDVTVDVRNDADVPIGLHDHVTDAEFVLDPDEERSIEFTPAESDVGRHEIEGYPASGETEEGDGHDHDHGSGDGHDHGTDGGSGHGSDGEETDGSGHGSDSSTLVTVEIRPENA